jgi:hypothetical protein
MDFELGTCYTDVSEAFQQQLIWYWGIILESAGWAEFVKEASSCSDCNINCMLSISICFTASGFGKTISITLLDLHYDFLAHSSFIILGSCLFLACKWQNGCQLDMYCTVHKVIQFKSCWTHWLRGIEGKYIFLPQKIILLKSLLVSIISPLSW